MIHNQHCILLVMTIIYKADVRISPKLLATHWLGDHFLLQVPLLPLFRFVPCVPSLCSISCAGSSSAVCFLSVYLRPLSLVFISLHAVSQSMALNTISILEFLINFFSPNLTPEHQPQSWNYFFNRSARKLWLDLDSQSFFVHPIASFLPDTAPPMPPSCSGSFFF